MDSFEDIIRKILREELASYFAGQEAEVEQVAVPVVIPVEKLEEPDVLTKEAFRKAAATLVANDNMSVSAKPLVEPIEPITVELIDDDHPVTDTASLLASMKEFCKVNGNGKEAKATVIMLGYDKFSSVPNDKAREVYDAVMEELA